LIVGLTPLQGLLHQLCELLCVPAQDHAQVLATQALMLGDATVVLTHETWSHFVKVHVELGKPTPATAPQLHRHLLATQIMQPAPYVYVLGVHPDEDRAYLCCAVPFPAGDVAMKAFMDMLKACVQVRSGIRDAAPGGVVWE
jgi:hypothetical protein